MYGARNCERCRLGSASENNRRVLHRARALKPINHRGNRRLLLADGDIEALNVFALLVEDGVDGNSRFASTAVTNDELALAATNRNHRVDGFDAGLHRLMDRLSLHDARSFDLNFSERLRGQRLATVDGVTDCVDHAAKKFVANRNLNDSTGPLDRVALANGAVCPEKRDTNVVFLEVEHHAANDFALSPSQLDKLTGHRASETVDAGDAIASGENRASLRDFDALVVVLNLLANDVANLFSSDVHRAFLGNAGSSF